MALFGFYVYVSHLKCNVTNIMYSNESYFQIIFFKLNILWYFVVIDYNPVEFSLNLTQGTYINSLVFFLNERNFILILIYYLEDIITFTKIANVCISYNGFLIFGVRNLILGVIFGKVHLGGAYIK